MAYGFIAGYDREVKSGHMSLAMAQAAAVDAIKSLRYGGKEYFWVNDLTPRMVVHPTKPELDGKDLTDNKDPNDKRLFIEFVKICQEKGAGYVDYLWPKPEGERPLPKISFVKLYVPWGWVIGSGVIWRTSGRKRRCSSGGFTVLRCWSPCSWRRSPPRWAWGLPDHWARSSGSFRR